MACGEERENDRGKSLDEKAQITLQHMHRKNKMSTWPSAYIDLEIVTSMAEHHDAMSFTNQMQFFLALTSYSHMTYHTL